MTGNLIKGIMTLSVGGLALMASAQAQDDLDVFKIAVDFGELATLQGTEEFDEYLSEAARDYCEEEAPGASRRALKRCEKAIISAVENELSDRLAVYAFGGER